MNAEAIEILLVEDSPGDIRLTVEALKEAKVRNNMSICSDGNEAMDFLRKKEKFSNAVTPDLILLDLNMPRKNGMEVLQEIKNDDELKTIPVVILTTSSSDLDVYDSYKYHANCYITKPVDLDQFMSVIKSIENFWLTIVRFPPST